MTGRRTAKLKLSSQGSFDIGVGKTGFGELNEKEQRKYGECSCRNNSLPGAPRSKGEGLHLECSVGASHLILIPAAQEKGPSRDESPGGKVLTWWSYCCPRNQEEELQRTRLNLCENPRAVRALGVVQEVRDWDAELLLSHAN